MIHIAHSRFDDYQPKKWPHGKENAGSENAIGPGPPGNWSANFVYEMKTTYLLE
jgi:hypothetical protein